MAAARRMGPKGSEVWYAMLDAAEDVLREQGYGELTSRCVAERVGVKQRLVYYYFATMDELIVETFRRLAVREIERLDNALQSNHSLREIWDICVQTSDTRLVSEFMALANRIPALRQQVREYIETCRKMHVAALSDALRTRHPNASLEPIAAAIFATSAALALHREAEIGISHGHAEVMAVIDSFIARLDPVD